MDHNKRILKAPGCFYSQMQSELPMHSNWLKFLFNMWLIFISIFMIKLRKFSGCLSFNHNWNPIYFLHKQDETSSNQARLKKKLKVYRKILFILIFLLGYFLSFYPHLLAKRNILQERHFVRATPLCKWRINECISTHNELCTMEDVEQMLPSELTQIFLPGLPGVHEFGLEQELPDEDLVGWRKKRKTAVIWVCLFFWLCVSVSEESHHYCL